MRTFNSIIASKKKHQIFQLREKLLEKTSEDCILKIANKCNVTPISVEGTNVNDELVCRLVKLENEAYNKYIDDILGKNL